MSCGYGEKLILYFYGEADAGLKAGVEAHLRACSVCREELAALSAAGARLTADTSGPRRAVTDAVMLAARARCAVHGRVFSWREALLSGALASVLAGIFAFSGRQAGVELAWNSGLDSSLDSVEYYLYQEQSELTAPAADWEYGYGELEEAGLNAKDNA